MMKNTACTCSVVNQLWVITVVLSCISLFKCGTCESFNDGNDEDGIVPYKVFKDGNGFNIVFPRRLDENGVQQLPEEIKSIIDDYDDESVRSRMKVDDKNNNTVSGRELSSGVTGLNNLLQTMTIKPDINLGSLNALNLPLLDFIVSDTVTFCVTDIICNGLNLGSMFFSPVTQFQKVIVSMKAIDVTTSCTMNWEMKNWVVSLESGSARMNVKATETFINLSLISSVPLSQATPNDVTFDGCQTTVEVEKIEVTGGLRALVFNLFEGLVRPNVKDVLEGSMCDQLSAIYQPIVTDVVDSLHENWSPYYDEIVKEDVNPLQPQNTLDVPLTVTLYDFTDKQNGFYDFTTNINENYGEMIVDSYAGSSVEPVEDLGINIALRSSVLDNKGFLEIPLADILSISQGLFFDNSVLGVFDAKMWIHRVRARGLDTFTQFNVFNAIAPQTFTNEFKLKTLHIEADLMVEVKSQSEEHQIENSVISAIIDLSKQVDNFTMSMVLEDIESRVSLLSAFETELMDDVPLGRILNKSCSLAVLSHFDWAQTEITYGKYSQPKVTNLLDTATSILASDIVEAVVRSSKMVFETGLSNFIATTMRESLQNSTDALVAELSKNSCPTLKGSLPSYSPRFVDFRELVWNATKAKENGATGMEPYGNTVSSLFDLFQIYFFDPSVNGDPKINEMLVKPLTQGICGTVGTWATSSSGFVDKSIFHCTISPTTSEVPILSSLGLGLSGGSNSIQIKSSMVENLDTIGYPLKILEPDKSNPNVLHNRFTFDKTLHFSTNLLLDEVANNFAVVNRDELKLSLLVDSLDVTVDFMAKIEGAKMMRLSLNDTLFLENIYCLLATIPKPNGGNPTATIANLTINYETLSILPVECIRCDSVGLQELTTVYSLLSAPIDHFSNQLIPFLIEVINGDDAQAYINNNLGENAAKACPSHPDYVPGFAHSDLSSFGDGEIDCIRDFFLPHLSRDGLQFLTLAVFLISYMGMVAVPYSLPEDYFVIETDPLVGQDYLNILLDREISNFTYGDSNTTTDDPDYTFQNDYASSSERDDVVLLNFQDASNLFESSLLDLFETLNQFLGRESRFGVANVTTVFENTTNSSNVTIDNSSDISNVAYTADALGINFLLRNIDGVTIPLDYSVTIPLYKLSPATEQVKLGVQSITFNGLDSFTNFEAFKPIAPQTIQWKCSLDHVSAEVVVAINVPGIDDEEFLTVSVGLESLNLTLAHLLAVNEKALEGSTIGPLLDSESGWTCLVPAFIAGNVTHIDTEVGSINVVSFQGFLPDDVQESLDSSAESIFDRYGTGMAARLPGILDQVFREDLNDAILYQLRASRDKFDELPQSKICPNFRARTSDGFVDLRDMFLGGSNSNLYANGTIGSTTATGTPYGDIPIKLHSFIQTYLTADVSTSPSMLRRNRTSGPMINKYLPPNVVVPGNIFDYQFNFNGTQSTADHYIQAKISDVFVGNLDTVGYPLLLMEPHPDNPHLMNNTIFFNDESRPLVVQFTLEANFIGEGTNISETLNISARFDRAKFEGHLMAKVNEVSFMNLPIQYMLNPYCLLATIQPPILGGQDSNGEKLSTASLDTHLNFEKVEISAECVSCTSPELGTINSLLSSPSGESDINDQIQRLLLNMKTPFDKALQAQIDALLTLSGLFCAFPDYETPAFSTEIAFNGESEKYGRGVLVSFSLLGFGMAILFYMRRRRMVSSHQKWLLSLPEEQLLVLYMKQIRSNYREYELTKMTKSMATSGSIPIYYRFGFPILVILSISLFFIGHLSMGAFITFKGGFAGQEFMVDQFLTFKVVDTILDAWSRSTWGVSFVLVVTSLIWPYFKQIISLILWFCPPNLISVRVRGKVIIFFDTVAKWSILDVFALLLAVPFYKVSFGNRERSYIPDNFFDFSVFFVLAGGVYFNLFAQAISQVTSHILTYYQENIELIGIKKIQLEELNNDEEEEVSTDSEASDRSGSDSDSNDSDSESSYESSVEEIESANHEKSLCRHGFKLRAFDDGKTMFVTLKANRIFGGTSIFTLFLLCVGCVLPSFSTEIFGLTSFAVEATGESTKEHYNIFKAAYVIVTSGSANPSARKSLGLFLMALVLLCTSFIVPLLRVVGLNIIWFLPRTRQRRDVFMRRMQILQAWQYLEVYVVSVLLLMWQGETLVQSHLDVYCDFLKDGVFPLAVYTGIIDEQNARCILINILPSYGIFILMVALLLLSLLNYFVSKAHKHEIEDYEESRQVKTAVEAISIEDLFSEMGDDGALEKISSKIQQQPVRFSDSFRAFLYEPEQTLTSVSYRSKSLKTASETDHNGSIKTTSETDPTLQSGIEFDISNLDLTNKDADIESKGKNDNKSYGKDSSSSDSTEQKCCL